MYTHKQPNTNRALISLFLLLMQRRTVSASFTKRVYTESDLRGCCTLPQQCLRPLLPPFVPFSWLSVGCTEGTKSVQIKVVYTHSILQRVLLPPPGQPQNQASFGQTLNFYCIYAINYASTLWDICTYKGTW